MRADGTPQMQCLGRADDQVKIRGFRVELGEIEAVLAQQPGVGTTAVILRGEGGIDQLVAFYVPSGGQPPAVKVLRDGLAGTLPPYMVPARFEPLPAMPRLPSGKIDRKVLKAQPLAAAAPAEGSDEPQTPAEEVLFAALEKLFPGQPIRRELDFFSDLGGHSLFAARITSTLRQDPRFAQATVSDIYANRRIGLIAEALQAGMLDSGAGVAERPFVIHSAWRRWRCGLAQAVAIPFLVLLKMAQWLAPFFAYHFYTGDPGDSVRFAIFASVLAFLVTTVLEFVVAWAGKWLVAGDLKPGSYPLWGLTYYRWWLADRLTEAVPTYMINGSPLYSAWLRLLGAKVGAEVNMGAVTLRVPELVTIGEGTSIGNAVMLENARVEGGLLHLGRIDIGANACIGSYTVIEGNTSLGDWAHLEGQSALGDGQQVPARKVWHGSPAHERGDFDPANLPPRPPVSRLRQVWENIYFIAGSLVVAVLFFMPVFPTFLLIDVLDVDAIAVKPLLDDGTITGVTAFVLRLAKFFVLSLPATMVFIFATVLLSALIRWAFLPRMKAGSWPIHSNRYLAKWLVNQIQESSLAVLHGIYATVFSAAWYRLLGARVGKETELSTALGVVPDMLTLGDECFIADAVMLGDEHIDGGWMTVQPTVVSRRSFVGNGAYVPDGTTIPENVLIGVMSGVPRNAAMQEGDTWLGSPPLHLPAREVVSGFPEHLTFAPSRWRKLGRGVVEAFRIAAPHALVIAVGYAWCSTPCPGRCRPLGRGGAGPGGGRRGVRLRHLLPGGAVQVDHRGPLPPARGAHVDALRLAVGSCHQHVRGHHRALVPALPARHALAVGRLQAAGREDRPRHVPGHHRHHRVRLREHRRAQRAERRLLPADPSVRGPGDEDRPRAHRCPRDPGAALHRAVRRQRGRRRAARPADAGDQGREHPRRHALARPAGNALALGPVPHALWACAQAAPGPWLRLRSDTGVTGAAGARDGKIARSRGPAAPHRRALLPAADPCSRCHLSVRHTNRPLLCRPCWPPCSLPAWPPPAAGQGLPRPCTAWKARLQHNA